THSPISSGPTRAGTAFGCLGGMTPLGGDMQEFQTYARNQSAVTDAGLASVSTMPIEDHASDEAGASLDHLGLPKTTVDFRRREILFSQGDPADTVMYIRKGGVRLSIVAPSGKEAIVGIL